MTNSVDSLHSRKARLKSRLCAQDQLLSPKIFAVDLKCVMYFFFFCILVKNNLQSHKWHTAVIQPLTFIHSIQYLVQLLFGEIAVVLPPVFSRFTPQDDQLPLSAPQSSKMRDLHNHGTNGRTPNNRIRIISAI